MLLLSAPALAQDPYAALMGTLATSAADEYRLGEEYVATSLWLTGRLADADQQLRVERITREVVASSDRPDLVFNVILLSDPEVNAAALPGGFLIVNKGALTLFDDDQLAFVIGHELSHVILRHSANVLNLERATHSMVELQASRAADSRKQAAEQAEALFLMMASHSRQLELEADLYGLLYAARAGYPAEASVSALQSMEDTIGQDIAPEELPWMTHPMFDERIDQLRRGFEGIRATHGQFDAGLAWLQAGQAEPAVAAFQTFLTLFPRSQAGWTNLGAAHLYQAIAATKDPWLDVLPTHAKSDVTLRDAGTVARERAREALARALRLDPTDPVALGLLGVLARNEGRLPEARTLLEQAIAKAPESAALHADLGNVAAQEAKTDEALAAWARARALAPTQPEPAVNTARLCEKLGRKDAAVAAWKAVLPTPAWGPEAAARLNALGVAVEVPVPAKATPETLTEGTISLAIGDTFDAAKAALGEPTLDLPQDADGYYRYVAWIPRGLEGVFRGDRVVEWALGVPGSARTRAGIGVGSAEADLRRAYGEPSQVYAVGAYRSLAWPERGLAANFGSGRVQWISLYPPP